MAKMCVRRVYLCQILYKRLNDKNRRIIYLDLIKRDLDQCICKTRTIVYQQRKINKQNFSKRKQLRNKILEAHILKIEYTNSQEQAILTRKILEFKYQQTTGVV
ncbi:unnamed protein product [Didymodactylos carnosus]|uniref:Uncharacterized protein n=1 Tax=Didymodactylos carnosus TaxID=1234261 RepID=A0A813V184_9BILA|nr:unnamed protein product [Didymodactylos carnosus]CAF3621686.1 unnamed protein product [Didymodactylos carnosus]